MENTKKEILHKDRGEEQPSPKGDQPSQPNSSASQNKTGRLAEIERAVEAHNAARRKRSVPPLEWSVHLAVKAESWAKNLCRRKIIERSGADGENLFWSWGDSDFADAVEAWLEEEQKYDGAKIGEGQAWTWKHFSQCVWHSTTHFGMGKAIHKGGKGTFIVAMYSPGGNVVGEKPFED